MKNFSVGYFLFWIVAILQLILCRYSWAWVLPRTNPTNSRGMRKNKDAALFNAITKAEAKENKIGLQHDNCRCTQRRKTWNKNKIKHKFHTAKKLERQGRWMEARLKSPWEEKERNH